MPQGCAWQQYTYFRCLWWQRGDGCGGKDDGRMETASRRYRSFYESKRMTTFRAAFKLFSSSDTADTHGRHPSSWYDVRGRRSLRCWLREPRARSWTIVDERQIEDGAMERARKQINNRISGVSKVRGARGQESFWYHLLGRSIQRSPRVSPPENFWKRYMRSGEINETRVCLVVYE